LQEQIKTKPGKLKGPLYVEALKESIYKNTPSYRINLAGCPNSCLLKIGKQ
jgi:dissimilatory sulfite reductase (desulfoviridin) alpha/beta subunit